MAHGAEGMAGGIERAWGSLKIMGNLVEEEIGNSQFAIGNWSCIFSYARPTIIITDRPLQIAY
jgi:hypothetical protein